MRLHALCRGLGWPRLSAGRPRLSTITESAFSGGGGGGGPPLTIIGGFLGAGKTTALRHMLGIERTDGGADYFNCDWLRENPRPDLV